MAGTMYEFEMMRMMRAWTLDLVSDLTGEQLLRIPSGFNNNVLWNVGHVLYYQCEYTYAFAGLPMPLPSPDKFKSWFANGTSPRMWEDTLNARMVMDLFKTISDTIVRDAQAGKFAGFKETAPFEGLTLHSVQEAVAFHNIHEGMHYSAISAMKRFL